MRTDLPSMSTGRAAAQASHAANAFWHEHGTTPDAVEWAAQTPQGFGTAIVLSCDINKLQELVAVTGRNGFMSDIVVDPDYVIPISSEIIKYMDISRSDDTKIEPSPTDPNKYLFHRSEVTCAYIFGDKEKLAPLLSGLPLYS